ncbi:Deoxyuridine 5'-triphosphate nucleotidohydrolase [bioreactor metagenome]|uniref:dUTP diphosphatase n=1 Tax=bioreactor metagenome TaxID=1076179 RepID=A0A645IY93_9ZZZZ
MGVIDNDYTGEIKVGLVNLSNQSYTIHPGDRIAQIVIQEVIRGRLCEADALDETKRGSGGFGSTGLK